MFRTVSKQNAMTRKRSCNVNNCRVSCILFPLVKRFAVSRNGQNHMSRNTVKLAFFMVQDFAGDTMLETVNILDSVQAAEIAAESKSKHHCKIPSRLLSRKPKAETESRRKQKAQKTRRNRFPKYAENHAETAAKIAAEIRRKPPGMPMLTVRLSRDGCRAL